MNHMIPLCLALVLAGCGGGAGSGTVDTDRFIDVVVALRSAAVELRHDTAAYDQRKDRILHDAGITEGELRAYVEHHGADLAHMAHVWQTINARMAEAEASVQ